MEDLAKLLNLIQILGSVQGVLKLQKLVYLLQQLGLSFHVKYEYGHYGPYSRELIDAYKCLEHAQFIEISDRIFPISSGIKNTHFLDDSKFSELAELLNTSTLSTLILLSKVIYLRRLEYLSEQRISEMLNCTSIEILEVTTLMPKGTSF